MILELFEGVNQKGCNESHDIIFIVSFSNAEITFLLLPLWVMFKNDFWFHKKIEIGLENVVD